MDKEKYRAPVVCKNCEFKNYSNFPKGIPISEVVCPSCGCKTLRPPNSLELDQINSLPEHRKNRGTYTTFDFGDLGGVFDGVFRGFSKDPPPKK